MVHIGEVARAALARSDGIATPLAGFADAPYLEADGEVIWVGARLPARHPRAVVTSCAPRRGVTLSFAALPARGWTPRLPILDEHAAARVQSTARSLGALLAGRRPGFPLPLARVEALGEAYRRDDPDAVFAASLPLLGCGAGFTPSGDDLTGAALFGRRFISPHEVRWQEIAGRLSREVAVRSHAVSAALFSDLARGQSFAPLHAVAEGLAGGQQATALAAARALAAVGHSSGWDMLAGFMIGMGIGASERGP